MRLKTLALGLTATALVACGGDDGGGKGYGDPIDNAGAEQAADQSVDQTMSLETLTQTPGDNAAIGSLNGVYASLSQVLNAKYAATAQQQASLTGSSTSNVDGPCLTTTTGGATYDMCDFGSGTIDGTISSSGETVTVDLTIATSASGSTTNIDMDGSVTIAADALTGDLAYTVTAMTSGQTVNYDIDATYDIGLVEACPTSGEMEVHGKWSVEGLQGSAADVWVKAEFGPNCGDVTLR